VVEMRVSDSKGFNYLQFLEGAAALRKTRRQVPPKDDPAHCCEKTGECLHLNENLRGVY